jgi:preprotein translocase subunit SecY
MKSGAGSTQKMPSFSQAGFLELKKRLLFVVFGLVIFRLGAHIPIPGVDIIKLTALFGKHKGGMLDMFNMFSGGALSRMSLFALGVFPYITASIIMQLLSVSLPSLEQLKKEGEAGRRKITQYTRYATLCFALFQSIGIAKMLLSQGAVNYVGMPFYITTALTLTTGVLFLMWLGEQMTEKGIGNGISLIIFSGIVSRLPAGVGQILTQVKQGQLQPLSFMFLVAVVFSILAFIVFIERGQRQIAINYAKRQQGNQLYAAKVSHLPLKINLTGVIPPIFAFSLLAFPSTIANFYSSTSQYEIFNQVMFWLSPGQPLYFMFLIGAIFFFAFFYAAMVFNPNETADNLKRSGAMVPGLRPGKNTADYIDKVMGRLTLIGAAYLALVALLPDLLRSMLNVSFFFGGTSILIVVVVIMDFITQVQSHLMSQKYESILKKSKDKSGQLGLLR